ncbi:MAG: DUF2914 domain-containing protein [Candidatus Paceibacterota bacterium]
MLNVFRSYKDKVQTQSFARVKRYWLSIAFVLGFVVDTITLNNVEQIFDNLVLLTHVLLSMTALFLMYAAAAGRVPEQWVVPLRKYAPLVAQYSFGGLLSGMLIFYGRSGAWTESWPFLIIILAVIAGNEIIKDRSARFLFNLTVLFVGLFAYLVLIIPVISGYMGPLVFLGSGLLALLVMYGYIRLLQRVIPNFIKLQMRMLVFMIGIVFAGYNFLYFANIIPPIPLSLKDVGIYHSVVKFDDGEYQLKYEEGAWWQFYKDSDTTFHPVAGGNIFCFASVFTPTRLHTDIYHTWEYYDEASKKWVEHSRLSYSISGGRDGGYRGYTLIKNFRDGVWRCSVETERGQVLGQEKFTVDSSEPPAPLVTKTE